MIVYRPEKPATSAVVSLKDPYTGIIQLKFDFFQPLWFGKSLNSLYFFLSLSIPFHSPVHTPLSFNIVFKPYFSGRTFRQCYNTSSFFILFLSLSLSFSLFFFSLFSFFLSLSFSLLFFSLFSFSLLFLFLSIISLSLSLFSFSFHKFIANKKRSRSGLVGNV